MIMNLKYIVIHVGLYSFILSTSECNKSIANNIVPGMMGRLTHLLRENRHFVSTASCVKTTLPLPTKNSDAMKLRRIFQVPTKTRPFSAGVKF